MLDEPAFEEDCSRAAIVISRLTAPKDCQAALVIDRQRLAASGALVVRFKANAAILDPTRREGDPRPWTEPPRQQPAPILAPSRPETTRPTIASKGPGDGFGADEPDRGPEDAVSTGEPD